MKIQMTLIGLGQIGTSIGMALTEKSDLIYRVGYDVNPKVMHKASKMGAVDKTSSSLKKAVETSDVVLMAIPTNEMQPMLEKIVPWMKEGAILMDTALSKEKVANWAADLLPEGCSYVGLTPVINPEYLINTSSGIDSARVDLFHHGMVAVSSPTNAEPKAIKFAADLTRLLGAKVLFADMLEVDSVMSATHTIPRLMAAALLNATVNQPNWRDAGKMAGRAYAEVSGPIEHLGKPATLAANALQNRDHVLRVLNSVIASIEILRDDIAAENVDQLSQRLERAYESRDQWWQDRHPDANPKRKRAIEGPSISSVLFGEMLRPDRRKHKQEEQDNRLEN
jgi:prephenate dehydrogenase